MKLTGREAVWKAVTEDIVKVDDMTEEEVIGRQFKLLAKMSHVADCNELPDLTNAMLAVYDKCKASDSAVKVDLRIDGVKFAEQKGVDHFAKCVKEIVKAFENHYIAVGDVDLVLDRVKSEVLSSTPVHCKPSSEIR